VININKRGNKPLFM